MHIAQRRIQQSPWSGTLLANVALLCLRGDEFDRFLHIIEYMVDESSNKSIAGIPTIEQLNEMFTACMDRGYAPGAIVSESISTIQHKDLTDLEIYAVGGQQSKLPCVERPIFRNFEI